MPLIVRRLRALLGRRRLEREMDEEMRLHLELEAAELVRSGVAPDEAWRQARLAFGGVERFKEDGRDARGVRWTEDCARDARHGVRQLRRSIGFTVAALITLSLGIGASTAMYSMLHAILVDPLPFDNSDELVLLSQCGENCRRMAIGNYVTVRDESRTLSAVAAFAGSSPIMRGSEDSEVLDGTRVTVELFRMTGVPALLGRTFAPIDTVSGRPRVVMLSEGAWRARFGADSGIVGRAITLDGQPATVIGVVPTRYAFPAQTEVWTLLQIDAKAMADRYWTDYTVLGRMRPRTTVADVAAEAKAIGGRLSVEFPEMRRQQFTVRPSRQWNGDIGTPITIFTAAVVFVLVIACTNLAGLLLARLTAREREIAVRAAMGADGGRIARQLLTETLVLSLAGGVLGTAVAWAMIEAGRASVPVDAITGWAGYTMSWSALGIALALGVATGAIIGVGPALRFSRPSHVQSLKEGVRSTSGARGTRLRRVLVMAQVAFSIVLLAAAGLLTRTAVNIYRADTGFRSGHVLTMRLRYPVEPDSTRRRPADFYDRLTAEIDRLPGVARAATVSWIPFTGYTTFGFEVEGRPPSAPGDRPWARMQAVTHAYFDVMRIPVLHGRAFNAKDMDGAPRVAIISESMARRLFVEKGEDAVGRALMLEGHRYEIVGVSRDVYHYGANRGGLWEVYWPQAQWPTSRVALVVRTDGEPAAASAEVTRVVHAFDRDIAISRVATMSAVADEYLKQYRVMAGMMVAFAVIALAISAIGLYGVISFAVAQRTREFGIRLALGAGRRELLHLVLGDGVRLVGIGVAAGLVGAFGATRAMRSLLYGVGPVDPLVLATATLTLGALALGASFAPARRAARVDPMTSLRAE